MRNITAFIFLLAVLKPATVTATEEDIFEDGSSFLAACNEQRLSEHWYCVGYVASAWDTHILVDQVCPPKPEGVTKGKLKRVVLAYLQAHPENLHLTAHSLVHRALVEAFPCILP